MKRILGWGMILMLAAGLCSCERPLQERHFFAMDTVMTLQIAGDESGALFNQCKERIEALEQIFSATLAESEIARLNESGSLALSKEAAALMRQGLEYSAATDGAFSLSLYPAGRLWGFDGEHQQVPEAAALEAVKPLIGDKKIRLEENFAKLLRGGAVDFGGIAKGYAGDALAGLLAEQGAAHYFLNLGGNVQVGGGNPNGKPWRIGIADPRGGEPIGMIELQSGAVVTSGGYQRNFEQDGKIYHHILDPETLYPAQSGLLSATVVAESGTLADAMSTALFVMGEERALAFANGRADLECILITEDQRIVLSEGLRERFIALNSEYQYEE